MIKIQNNTASRQPLPPFLRGLKQESLYDLSWTDPALGLQDAAWWPEANESPPLPDEFHRYGDETLTVDAERQVVVVTRQVVPFSDEEKAAMLARAKERALQRINTAYTAAAQPLVKEYPEVETKGWDQQKADAEAYLSWHETQQGEPPQMMVLDKILAGRNGDDGTETLYELSLAVRRNALAFAEFQLLTGKRQRLAKQVRDAGTLEALDAIRW